MFIQERPTNAKGHNIMKNTASIKMHLRTSCKTLLGNFGSFDKITDRFKKPFEYPRVFKHRSSKTFRLVTLSLEGLYTQKQKLHDSINIIQLKGCVLEGLIFVEAQNLAKKYL